ncbi:alpha-D-ribose 1-methylphosphonate 5-triphosphate diphosphatase [Falsihalocynthiibacter sp. SS001]|uniref:alpha-D-ribose 1-methylphosphonate 5-triphosphate diphosphatase n=1 Tax=Falsihalocynthiibacter sp. SS001 TaxID=3349698 RepID=UPI0036D377C1
MISLPSLRLIGADVLADSKLQSRSITISDGRIATGPAHAIDLSGCYILPGIVDLHGDAFERQIAPRPSAIFPLQGAIHAVETEAAANGITTAWMAQSWSWEGGLRGPNFTEAFLAALAVAQPALLVDLRVQLRIETHTVDTFERLRAVIQAYGIDYAIFNNHLPEARAMAKTNPEKILAWAGKANRTPEEHMAIVTGASAQQERVPRYLCQLANDFDRLGVTYGSHDDPDAATRDYYNSIGARVCEFPTGTSAAHVAKVNGNPILMGAPNVVRGGSQSGNIAATHLIEDGLCDILVSDYHYPSLAQAAFTLADAGLCDLATAWGMISTAPAAAMNLDDRGTIEQGKRADLVIIDKKTRRIGATLCNGRVAYLSGEIGTRFVTGMNAIPLAAE